MIRRLLSALVSAAVLLNAIFCYAVVDGEVRNPAITSSISSGSLFWWGITAVVCWVISGATHRVVFKRAPTTNQHVTWTISLLIGVAAVIGLMRSL